MEVKKIHTHLIKTASSREDYFPKQSVNVDLANSKDDIYKWFEPANNYPEFVIQSIRHSTTLEAILFEDLIYKTGSGFQSSDSLFENYLNKDIVNINNEVFKVVFKDSNDHLNKLGNVFLELVFDENLRLLSILTIQPQKCRLIKDDKNIWIYPDWAKFNKEKAKKMPLYPRMKKFKSEGITFYKSIYHIKTKALGFDHYGINEKLIEALLLNEKEHRRNEWQNQQLKKGFKKDFFLVTEYPLSEKEKKKVDEAFEEDSGSENAGGVYAIEGEGAKLVAATSSYEFDFNKDDTTEKTFLKMGFPRSLLGIKSGAAFSVEQVESDYDQYLPKIEYQQTFLMSEFNKIFKEHTAFNTSDVNVINTPPSVILQNYMQYMNDEQKNKVIEQVFKRYGIS
jgi:hypothetical protein